MSLPSTITDVLLDRLTGMVVASGGATYKVLEVYTGEVITALPQSTPEDVERAYADARAAQAVWSSWPLDKRLKVVRKFHSLLLKDYAPIVDLMQAETGKAPAMKGFIAVCDAAHYAGAGVDGVIFGPSGDGFHSTDEYVDIESLVESAKVIAATVIDWCGIRN